MAKLQAASVPIAKGSCAPRAAVPWDRQTGRQTDRSRYRLMTLPPTYGGGIINQQWARCKNCANAARMAGQFIARCEVGDRVY